MYLSSHLLALPRAPPLGNGTPPGLLLLSEPLGHQLLVLGGLLLGVLDTSKLLGLALPLALEHEGGDKALDLGGLPDLLALLVFELAGDDVLPNIVLLGEVEEVADLGGTLRTEAAGDRIVGESGDISITLLGHDEVKDGDVVADDASTDGDTLPLSAPTGAVAALALGKEKAHTGVGEDSLLHGETLLVVSATDAHDVSLELIPQDAPVNLLGHAAVVKVLELLLVIDLNDLLHARGRVRNVHLHDHG